MADDEYTRPEEAVSDAPDMIDEDLDIEAGEPEAVKDGKCTECGSNRITKMARASSPDDFVWQYECKNCGATWED